MDLMSGYKNCVQGVVGLVFGNENSASSEDSYVERLLDRISNGVLAEDRRTAIAELQFVVAESRSAQLAFGAIGLPVLLSVLKEECDDVEMVRGAQETLVSALTPIDQAKALKNKAQPTLMNTDLLSREAESISLLLSLLEIQKILVFEGSFEKIFSIINEEGCSEGGVVVQDCLELLNNLIRNNAFNQVLLRERIGFDPLISILKLRGSSYSFTQQKALRCIGDLIANHPKNLDALASKVLGEEPQVEPALYSILRIILRTSSMQEFVAADYVFKCFCEKNLDGQAMLASTLIPQPQPTTHAPPEDDVNMSFGSMLLHGLTLSQNDGDLETCSRAASVLSHVLKDNIQCKERVLRIELEEPTPSLGARAIIALCSEILGCCFLHEK